MKKNHSVNIQKFLNIKAAIARMEKLRPQKIFHRIVLNLP